MFSVTIFTARKRSCGKVMFLQVSVILFTGVGCLVRGWVGCLVPEGMPGLGEVCSGVEGGAWWKPPRTAIAAGGTHPTGMNSCSLFFAEPATQPTFLLVATSHSILLTDINGKITLPINVSYGRVRAMDYDFDTNRTCYVSAV